MLKYGRIYCFKYQFFFVHTYFVEIERLIDITGTYININITETHHIFNNEQNALKS